MTGVQTCALPIYILRVASKVAKRDTDRTYLHKGLSKRSFSNTWQLGDDVRVSSVNFADYLVKKGMSFREAYKKSAQLVNIAEKQKKRLDELDFKTVEQIDKSIKNDVMKIFDIEYSINQKKSYGGTGTKSVLQMLKKVKKEYK